MRLYRENNLSVRKNVAIGYKFKLTASQINCMKGSFEAEYIILEIKSSQGVPIISHDMATHTQTDTHLNISAEFPERNDKFLIS